MDADNKPTCEEVRPFACTIPHTQGKEESVMNNDQKKPILPLALRDTEITDADVEVMLRVARDKNATSGRYKRTPKRLPTAEQAVAQK